MYTFLRHEYSDICCFLFIELLCQSIPCFLAFANVIDEVPVFNSEAVFPVRINIIAGGYLPTIWICRDSVYVIWGIKCRSRIVNWSRCRHFTLDHCFKRSLLILLGNWRPDINLLWQSSSASFLSSYIFTIFIFILRWIKLVTAEDVKSEVFVRY